MMEKENTVHNIFKFIAQHMEKIVATEDHFIGYYRYCPKYSIHRRNGTTVSTEIFYVCTHGVCREEV